jgi:methyl-accepting chemotaxis protein-1 (serine sensor receptor)
MKLKTSVLISFSLQIVLMLSAALYGISSLNSALNAYERDVRGSFSSERAVYELALQYRLQMLQWKNLLIKVKSQENLDKYRELFDQQQDLVSAQAKELLARLDGESKAKLVVFIDTHTSLRDVYLKAMWDFSATAFDNAVADATLAELDRKPELQLLEVQKSIKATEQRVSTHANESASSARLLSIAVMLCFSIGGLWGSWVVASKVTRRIGGDPKDVVDVAKEMSAGDLRFRSSSPAAMDESILFHFEHMRISLATLVQRVRYSAIGVSHASQNLVSRSDQLSDRTEQQAAAVEQTAASMGELSEKVNNNAKSAELANKFAAETTQLASNGGDAVALVAETMLNIQTASRRMSDIIGVIDGIAFQTNILALNAAVEAARAGEHGRGFAVVSSEVRSLAARTLDAAKEIKSIINASVERVDIGSSQAESAGMMMREIVTSIGKVGDLIHHISVASTEQAASVSEIESAIELIDRVTQENSSLVESTLSITSELTSSSNELQRLVSEFQVDEEASSSVPVPWAMRVKSRHLK